jgi:hypothetical protein
VDGRGGGKGIEGAGDAKEGVIQAGSDDLRGVRLEDEI